MNTIVTVADLLRGCEAGDMQTVGIMQVIPLLGKRIANDVAMTGDVRVSNENYGHMKFSNTADVPAIIPQHAGYLTTYGAQDHATPDAVIVNKEAELNTAMCIEQSQGGRLKGTGDERLIIMPFHLRQEAFPIRSTKRYSKLWDAISDFTSRLGLSRAGGHINVFLEHFQSQLEHFIAEFEHVDRQLGALIFINGHLVGIERYPSAKHFEEVWDTLIRECYGSLAHEVAATEQPRAVDTRIPMASEFDDVDGLVRSLREAQASELEAVTALIRSVLNEPLTVVAEGVSNSTGWKLTTFDNDHFIGQAVSDGDTTLYLSIIATEHRRTREPTVVEAFAL